jgi:hypothetical protein
MGGRRRGKNKILKEQQEEFYRMMEGEKSLLNFLGEDIFQNTKIHLV